MLSGKIDTVLCSHDLRAQVWAMVDTDQWWVWPVELWPGGNHQVWSSHHCNHTQQYRPDPPHSTLSRTSQLNCTLIMRPAWTLHTQMSKLKLRDLMANTRYLQSISNSFVFRKTTHQVGTLSKASLINEQCTVEKHTASKFLEHLSMKENFILARYFHAVHSSKLVDCWDYEGVVCLERACGGDTNIDIATAVCILSLYWDAGWEQLWLNWAWLSSWVGAP